MSNVVPSFLEEVRNSLSRLVSTCVSDLGPALVYFMADTFEICSFVGSALGVESLTFRAEDGEL